MSRDINQLPVHWTPLQEAFYLTVHNYQDPSSGKRGAEVLGPKIGKAARTLSNEANPDVDGHKLGLEDSVTVQLLTGDFRTLHVYAALLQHIAIPLPDFEICGDAEILNRFSAWQAAMGFTCQEIHNALEDHKITKYEARRIRTCGEAHIREFLTFLSRLDSLVDKP